MRTHALIKIHNTRLPRRSTSPHLADRVEGSLIKHVVVAVHFAPHAGIVFPVQRDVVVACDDELQLRGRLLEEVELGDVFVDVALYCQIAAVEEEVAGRDCGDEVVRVADYADAGADGFSRGPGGVVVLVVEAMRDDILSGQ